MPSRFFPLPYFSLIRYKAFINKQPLFFSPVAFSTPLLKTDFLSLDGAFFSLYYELQAHCAR